MLLLSAALLAAVGVAVALRSAGPAWEVFQERYRDLAGLPPDRPLGIEQLNACTGEVDRCTTCHLGVLRPDLLEPQVPLPLRAHPPGLDKHPPHQMGCSACHGGTGRALEQVAAHGFPGSREVDVFHRQPHLQAACARCHVPGDSPGMETLVRGANLYLELGCQMCHPLTGDGRGGWDFGPDLRASGRRSVKFLRTSLVDPSANFAQSTMPSFAVTFENEPAALEDLVVFLESLVLPRAIGCDLRQRSTALVRLPCASCHAAGGKAGGRFAHRCTYILQRSDQLSCASCHPQGVPAPGPQGERCPVLVEQRKACAACHDQAEGGAGP
jgi:hypothetical protein